MSTLESGRLELSCDQRLCKVDENPDFTFVLGVVLVPERFDNQGDICSADVIERAAHGFMEESGRPGVMHKARLTKREAAIVECQVVRSSNYSINGTTIPLGAWIIGMRVYDADTRRAIRQGLFSGFSIGANADYQTICVEE